MIVKITPDKILLLKEERKGVIVTEDNSLIPHLEKAIQIDKNVTFGRMMNLINNDKDLLEIFFHTSLAGHSISPFIEDMNSTTENEEQEVIVMSWNSQVSEYLDEGLWINPDIHSFNIEDKEKENSFSLSFRKLADLKDALFELDMFFLITKIEDRKIKHLFKSKKWFTVYDVIGGILDEITFHGYPEKRDDKFVEIKDIKDEHIRRTEAKEN